LQKLRRRPQLKNDRLLAWRPRLRLWDKARAKAAKAKAKAAKAKAKTMAEAEAAKAKAKARDSGPCVIKNYQSQHEGYKTRRMKTVASHY
jgi:regulator of protease activity HflC (stomatin/prohibitin superfamily)